jgi:hypothetical protein
MMILPVRKINALRIHFRPEHRYDDASDPVL